MKEFFDKLYYRIYFSGSVNKNFKKKQLAIGCISFFQTANVLTLLNAFIKVTGLNFYYNIRLCFILFFIAAIVLNIYYFEIKKNGEKIMNLRKYDPEDNIVWHYIILSLFGIFFSLLIYTEF